MGAKIIFSALLMFSFLFACKKETDEPPKAEGSLQLIQLRTTNSANAGVFVSRLDYDGENRLIGIYDDDGLGLERQAYQISYPEPSTVKVREISPDTVYSREIFFTLDGLGRPSVKFERRLLRLGSPSPFQRSVTEFTDTYTYGSGGLLERTIKRYFDSTYAPTTVSGISSYRSSDTVIHTNSGGNLAYSLTTGVDTIVSYAPGPVSTTIRRERSREDYIYNMQLRLGNYGKNAFLYAELVALSAVGQPIFLPYRNLADKYVKTSEILNSGGFWVPDSESRFEYPKGSAFLFNELNLLTRIQYKPTTGGATYTTDYSYR